MSLLARSRFSRENKGAPVETFTPLPNSTGVPD